MTNPGSGYLNLTGLEDNTITSAQVASLKDWLKVCVKKFVYVYLVRASANLRQEFALGVTLTAFRIHFLLVQYCGRNRPS